MGCYDHCEACGDGICCGRCDDGREVPGHTARDIEVDTTDQHATF